MRPATKISTVFALVIAAALGSSQTDALAKDKSNLTKLQKVYASAKTTFTKKPANVTNKKKYVAATVAFGTATMNTQTMKPRDKYTGALRLYREALKWDPKNREALQNKKLIEDIYTSMGRPIPK